MPSSFAIFVGMGVDLTLRAIRNQEANPAAGIAKCKDIIVARSVSKQKRGVPLRQIKVSKSWPNMRLQGGVVPLDMLDTL
eukprot:2906388-Amphidinium_carterae.1